MLPKKKHHEGEYETEADGQGQGDYRHGGDLGSRVVRPMDGVGTLPESSPGYLRGVWHGLRTCCHKYCVGRSLPFGGIPIEGT